MRAVLLSTYELGRQPFGLASPAAWLRRAGVDVVAQDLSRQRLDEAAVRAADVVAVHLSMHTATRLALPVIDRVRMLNPDARIGAFGLYAPANRTLLETHGVAGVFGGEFEADLVRFVGDGQPGTVAVLAGRHPGMGGVARLDFITPDRTGLPPLADYAMLQDGARRRVAGYTEASRGCKHVCRHCPVVPIYGGQFRIVAADVVLADVRQQVAAGATHVTFGDPDFFNGPAHARRVVDALHREFPTLTYDVTIKVEHLIRHAAHLPALRDTGCLFVTSAVESMDDTVLASLQKGHTAADVERAVALCRQHGVPLSPTLVPFTPWTTIENYRGLLAAIARLDLAAQIAPVQLGIRLLVPPGSRLLELEDIQSVVSSFDAAALAYPWTHSDPRVDTLQREVMALVGRRLTADREAVFREVWSLAHDEDADPRRPAPRALRPEAARRPPVPYLNEPWYC